MSIEDKYWESKDVDFTPGGYFLVLRQVVDMNGVTAVLDPVADFVSTDFDDAVERTRVEVDTHRSVELLFRASWFVYLVKESGATLVKQFIVYPHDADLVDPEDLKDWARAVNKRRAIREARQAFRIVK